MNYADIKQYDISNGPGVRISLFVSGCTHRCKNCFNEEAWDFNYGKPFTGENIDQILEYLAPDYIWGRMMAASLVTSLPVVIMYGISQHLIRSGSTDGGVKG